MSDHHPRIQRKRSKLKITGALTNPTKMPVDVHIALHQVLFWALDRWKRTSSTTALASTPVRPMVQGLARFPWIECSGMLFFSSRLNKTSHSHVGLPISGWIRKANEWQTAILLLQQMLDRIAPDTVAAGTAKRDVTRNAMSQGKRRIKHKVTILNGCQVKPDKPVEPTMPFSYVFLLCWQQCFDVGTWTWH